ncbi:hypothetical protein G7A66_12310 [Altererythrobacter sp. SALINAS58]|uniref:hypothetical protein n=1 Tax=Alteripontixanthobacter muriae TaxID=2705546 RepID=UPI001576A33C|nr:hypothetical protein [Alteripontixanthobacter muriae]NTZ43852.1 hypothetical protein [Alteripontixanthobacter muriae]
MMRPLLFLLLGFNLGACSEHGSTNVLSGAASEAQRAEKMPHREEKSFNGWGRFNFGMNYGDALTAYPGLVWKAESVRKCRDEMPSSGCTLDPADGSRFPLTAGVALLPNVSFNQEGKLAAVRLDQFLRSNVKPAHCEGAYGQLWDGLQETWGDPTVSSSDEREVLIRRTPGGREFLLGVNDGAVVGREAFNVQPDGRQIILRFGYIGASDLAPAVCHLSILYLGPKSLQPPLEQRTDPLKNWY